MNKAPVLLLSGWILLLAGCLLPKPGTSRTDAAGDPALLGEWKYVDCNYKNTSVDGTLGVASDGWLAFAGQVHQDYPTEAAELRVRAMWAGGEIRYSELPAGMPVTSYYTVSGRFLYFAESPIGKPEEKDETLLRDGQVFTYRSANWVYKLERLD
jgi:hypothetical protein